MIPVRLEQFQREYQQAPDDTYTNDMHRALLDLLVSMDARIQALEAMAQERSTP